MPELCEQCVWRRLGHDQCYACRDSNIPVYYKTINCDECDSDDNDEHYCVQCFDDEDYHLVVETGMDKCYKLVRKVRKGRNTKRAAV